MSNSFRIEAAEMQGWHTTLAARTDVRGVPAIAKEIEAQLAKKDAEGFVVLSRHQLFTWAEALQGAATRSIQGAAIEPIVADMRSILTGKPVVERAVPGPYAPAAAAMSQELRVTENAPARHVSPAPVLYGPPQGAAAAGGSLVSGAQLADLVRDMIRSARSELAISSPWDTGIETLHADIVALPPAVQVRIVSRRPAKDDAAFHQAMDQLGRRRAVTAFSNHIQTRLIVQDDTRALVGAASIPGPASREAAILLTDRASIAAVKAHFDKVHAEAAGPTWTR